MMVAAAYLAWKKYLKYKLQVNVPDLVITQFLP